MPLDAALLVVTVKLLMVTVTVILAAIRMVAVVKIYFVLQVKMDIIINNYNYFVVNISCLQNPSIS